MVFNHSRDIAILIVLLWFNIVYTTPAYFSTFYVPTLVDHEFLYASLLTFLQITIFTGWWTHAFRFKVSILVICQVCSPHYIAVQINTYSKSTTVINVATMKNADNFCYVKETIMYHHFVLLVRMNGTQMENTAKSIKNVLYLLWYDKRHLLGWSNVE